MAIQATSLVWTVITAVLFIKIFMLQMQIKDLESEENVLEITNAQLSNHQIPDLLPVEALERLCPKQETIQKLKTPFSEPQISLETLAEPSITEISGNPNSPVLDSSDLSNLSPPSNLEDMMYLHPEFPSVRGRPFSGLTTHSHILKEYLASSTIELDYKNKIEPRLVTGLSDNHFSEHQVTVESVFEKFKDQVSRQKIVFYDLGLTSLQAMKIRDDERFIYKKFDFSKYPSKTKWLTNMSFKVFAMMECLMEYKSCMWFDTSIRFEKNYTRMVDKYVYERGSSFVYYIKPAPHNVAWATHPLMFAYLPSNISRLNTRKCEMSQGGATITFNTKELQQGVMKWAIACALTPECIMPNYELTETRVGFGTKWNPFGNFEFRHCEKKTHALNPFNCHRYDQSMWMILVANLYDYDYKKFRPSMAEVLGIPDRKAGMHLTPHRG